MSCNRLLPVCLCTLTLLLIGVPLMAQSLEPLFLPIGGGYADTFPGLLAAAIQRDGDGRLNIVLLPATYASNAVMISDEERAQNLHDATIRRTQLQAACDEWAAGLPCEVTLAPVFTRADAHDQANIALFNEDAKLDVIFILGGDQMIAMQALANTPLEIALAAAYRRGVIVAGTSAGLSVQSRVMIAGYSDEGLTPADGLKANAVNLWQTEVRRGLSFGVQDAILEQHFWERSRLPRLLNALAQPGAPPVGVGVDGATGIRLRGGTLLEQPFGLYTVGIFDAATFGGAANASFGSGTLSLRPVLFHTLAPGNFTYDLETRTHSLAAPPTTADRRFDSLTLPAGAGALLLAGDLSGALADHAALAQFVELSGGAEANILVVLRGYASQAEAEAAANAYAAALGVPGVTAVWQRPADEFPAALDTFTGILVTSAEMACPVPATLGAIGDAWRAGTPLLLDNAAAAAAGTWFSRPPVLPNSDDAAEIIAMSSLLQGTVDRCPGLGLLDVMVEPRIANDNRWGRLVSLAYAQPDQLAFGLNAGAALVITADGAAVLGDGGTFMFDLRAATLALGDNGGYVIANGWLDVLAAGDTINHE